MIRFFRQFRQRLLKENKFSKYLLYAVGEILLVVIGILIALQVDTWNNERKEEEKTRTILSDLMDELVADFNKTTSIMKYYSGRDSVIFLVLNDRVSLEDYEKNEIPYLNTVADNYDRVDLNESSYAILTQNLDIIPQKYKEVVSNLNRLYTTNKKWVDQYDEEMGVFVSEVQNHYRKNYAWFSGYSASDRKAKLDYMLNNFRYKNDVDEYRTLGEYNQMRFSVYYRQEAIKCYQEIAGLLNRSKYHESFIIDPEVSKKLLGDWEMEGNPEVTITFFEEDKRLYIKNKDRIGRNEVFWLSSSKLLTDNLYYGTLTNQGGEDIIKFNSFDLKRIQ